MKREERCASFPSSSSSYMSSSTATFLDVLRMLFLESKTDIQREEMWPTMPGMALCSLQTVCARAPLGQSPWHCICFLELL